MMNIRNLIRKLVPPKLLKSGINIRNRICGAYYVYQRPQHYQRVIKIIKEKVTAAKKIKVGFFVVLDSMFSMEGVFAAMLNDTLFSPFIVVIPYVSRGKDNMFFQMAKTFTNLSARYRYANIFKSYNEEQKKFIDFSNQCDIACFSTPYDSATYKYYRITYLSRLNIVPVYTTYGYTVSNWYAHMYQNRSLACLWKFFLENDFVSRELKERSYFNPSSLITVGYTKMDRLSTIKNKTRDRKRIIIAPHHTITGDDICFSCFIQYADFFLALPPKYPQIDFIFRPHPLLRTRLVNDKVWSSEKTETYFKNMQAIPNVEYQDGGDYFETFVNSDAMIHDCGSFMAEYLYTDHPVCFMLKDKSRNQKNYNTFALECIDHHYYAFNEQDIIHFIDDVVINGNDTMKQKRLDFANEKIKINYAHVTQKIMENIKQGILG